MSLRRMGIGLPRFSQLWRFRKGRPRYLLYDTFNTALAAGSVNGTVAEPVGGTRTVTDTNGALAIANGAADFVGLAALNGDPAMRYKSVSRTLGRVLLCSVTAQTGSTSFGYDNNTAGNLHDGFRPVTGSVQVIIDGGASIAVAPITLTIPYELCLVMRLSGLLFFIKGGVYTHWTLIYISEVGSAAMFPFLGTYGNVATFTADSIRIPAALWLPVPLASDSFNRANGALGNSDGAGHAEANGGAGLAWTGQVGTWQISTNAANCSALSGGVGIATVATPSADVIADVEVTRAAGVAGLCLRYQDSDDYLIAYHDGTNAKCDQVVAGVTTNLRSAAATYSAGAVLRVILDGTTGWLFYNNAAVGASFTVPASTYGNHGLYVTDTGPTLDDFTAWPRGAGGEYEALSRF